MRRCEGCMLYHAFPGTPKTFNQLSMMDFQSTSGKKINRRKTNRAASEGSGHFRQISVDSRPFFDRLWPKSMIIKPRMSGLFGPFVPKNAGVCLSLAVEVR